MKSMYYYNAKYTFALPGQAPQSIAGGIISAAAMPAGQLVRRDFRKYSYLQHRLFDPQLYLSSLDPNVARKSVLNLASWPWFCPEAAPEYDSNEHKSIKDWKDRHAENLLRNWPGCAVGNSEVIAKASRSAVKTQLDLGCEMVILPIPLTTLATQQFASQIEWIDAGIQACKELKVAVPVLATVAISDSVLRGVDATQNPLLHTISNQVSARSELAGVYILPEMASENGYVCTSRDTLLSVLLLTDDFVRGAGKIVVINYVGAFGAVASAAAGSVWSSGYYRSQRRLKLADFEENEGRTMPRYHSLKLAGDIGLEHDIESVYREFGDRIFTNTKDGETLERALASGTYPPPEWAYTPTNITAAAGHYNEAAHRLGQLSTQGQDKRVETVQRWLENATFWSRNLQKIGIKPSPQTELTHQAVWLDAFQAWRSHAGL